MKGSIITRGFALRCVKAESLGPEGSMIGYDTKKKKRTKNINLTSSIFRASAPKNCAARVFGIRSCCLLSNLKTDSLRGIKQPRASVVGFIPRRDVCLQTPVGVQLFLLMFYPPKGLCIAEYRRRSNCFYLCIIVLGNVYWTFNLQAVFCLFETLKMFYLIGRTVIKSVL